MTGPRKTRYRRPLDDRLAERPPRDPPAGVEVATARRSQLVRLDKPEEVAAVAVGMLLLRKVREFGQTRLFERAIEDVYEECKADLTPEEVMHLEVEAYEILDWIAGGEFVDADEAAAVASRDGSTVYYDPHAPYADLVRRAIAEGFDLKIDYFSLKRGQMNTRRISPVAVDAETYVRAYCHARRAERVFRLNRITRCIPIGGRPVERAVQEARTEEELAGEPAQISLLEE